MTTAFKSIRHSINITFVRVTLLKVNWLVRRFDVTIRKSTFQMGTFSGDSVNLINIINSTAGQFTISAGYHMTVFYCNIDGSTRLGSTSINADTSDVTIINSSFFNHKGKARPLILSAVSSHISTEMYTS